MLGFLAGLPGQLATVLSRLSAVRAGYLDRLDGTVSSRAPASTALSNAVWTAARGGRLDCPTLRAPIEGGISAGGLIGDVMSIVTNLPNCLGSVGDNYIANVPTAWTYSANYAGAGVLESAIFIFYAGYGITYDVELVIDGVTVFSATAQSTSTARCLVGSASYDATNHIINASLGSIPFYSSLVFRAKTTSAASNFFAFCRFRKVA